MTIDFKALLQPIKNGGHSYAGGSTTNIGTLMELGLMNEVNLDETLETVTVKGGALWFHVYKELVSKHLDGFIVNGGRCPTVGVNGFMLGGRSFPVHEKLRNGLRHREGVYHCYRGGGGGDCFGAR